ncbi:MAG: bifunctional tRNA (5-methylaminomethyl-2-thiouridine)(34)-methyltransferase MnmD/FAD-dependent 5-carboxymethylaminomethyl-2-thiouridine(34) oxidoreductase MnmC [Rhodocyclaceae bacterium]|nr:bifunctional tRNA (5-methylaminomethyl-2-thiouridine)(34)-methyltransferase MnmD/FAD-dependent 5-carboxymethylaminomethyl-2-thiouridine(34) oxidoreductase MnmC [Rhodocyclaceae bacterium]
MSWRPILPAELTFDENGTPYSSTFGDVYHSAGGGLAQARHVFLAGNGLPARWRGKDTFVILETGFGFGLNFLATWQAWHGDPTRPRRLHYLSIEKHPFRAKDLARFYGREPELAPFSRQLIAAWPSLVSGYHRLHFEAEGVILTLIFADVREALPDLAARVDAFYLDGFAPTRNPEMWSAALCADLAWLAAKGATCATWCVAGNVRRALTAAGFSVEKQAGFGGKKEMLTARFVGEAVASQSRNPGRIAIVGAGIAGMACAERLAARGLSACLFERRAQPGLETSGNHQAVLLPILARTDQRLHRLHRCAFFYARHRLSRLAETPKPPMFSPCGVFQIGRDAEHQRRQAEIVAEQAYPDDFVQFLEAEAAAELIGLLPSGPGWWFPQGGWLAPASVIDALDAAAIPRIERRMGCEVAGLEETTSGWRLLDGNGQCLWQGETVILAQALALRRLPQSHHLPLRAFRGQVSHLPAQRLDGRPHCVVCREGYLAPAHQGIASLGATFQRSEDLEASVLDHEKNLARLSGMLPTLSDRFVARELAGRVGVRPVSPDKLPMVGALPRPSAEQDLISHVEWPRWPGLYVATGYGARGFVWAFLMAELLACQLCEEPLPVGHELAAAVDAARFPFHGQL